MISKLENREQSEKNLKSYIINLKSNFLHASKRFFRIHFKNSEALYPHGAFSIGHTPLPFFPCVSRRVLLSVSVAKNLCGRGNGNKRQDNGDRDCKLVA